MRSVLVNVVDTGIVMIIIDLGWRLYVSVWPGLPFFDTVEKMRDISCSDDWEEYSKETREAAERGCHERRKICLPVVCGLSSVESGLEVERWVTSVCIEGS